MIYYLFAMLDSFKDNLCIIVTVLGMAGAIFTIINSIISSDKSNTAVLKVSKSLYVALFLAIFNMLLPNTKQAAFIFIAPKIIENKDVQATVSNIPELTQLGTEFLKQKLKGALEDGKGGQAS